MGTRFCYLEVVEWEQPLLKRLGWVWRTGQEQEWADRLGMV